MSDRPPQRLLETPSWLLTQIAAQVGRRTREVFDSAGAGRHHYAILCAVEEFGPCSQAEVGRRLHLDRKDVADRVAELEQQHCIDRRPDPDDPRRKVLRLTPRGIDRLEEIHERLRAVQDDLVHGLDRSERAALVSALQTILGR